MKVRISTIISIILYHISLVQIYYIKSYSNIVVLGIFLVGLFLLFNYKTINKEYKKNNFLIILWLSIVLISSIVNNSKSGFLFVIKIVEIFLFMEYCASNNRMNNVINIFFYLTLIYLIINDLFLLKSVQLKYGYNEYYLIGNKFTIGLQHILLYVLFLQKNINNIGENLKKKIVFVLLFVFSVIISIKVKCSTTILGNILVLILLSLPKKIKRILCKPNIVSIILFICSIMFFAFSNILNISSIKYIIEDFLGKDISLTGRMNIYKQLPEIISKNIILGYGYGNSYDILMEYMNAPNTQNGLLECIFNYGIIGTILLILVIYNVFKAMKKDSNVENMFPIVSYIYLFIFMSSIEISIGIPILVMLSIINTNLKNIERKEKDEKSRNNNIFLGS